MKTMKRMMILALLAMISVGLKAQEVKVVYSDFVGGMVAATAFDGQKVIITVTPDEGYYIAKDDIEVIAVLDPTSATRGDATLPIGSALELTLVDAEGNAITDGKGGEMSDPDDLTEPRCYAFEVPEGLGAWVRSANFQEAVGFHLEIDENTTELDEKLLSEYPNLKKITIKNDQQVISLGNCDVSGLIIDVPGNLYNEYLTTEGWDKAKEITSTTGVEMEGVAFGENNSYDTFVSKVSVKIPSVLNAFVIVAIKDGAVVIQEIADGIIPAGVPVLLLSKAHQGNDFRTASSDKEGSEYNSLLLAAGEGGLSVKLGEVYLLYNDVFYLSQAGTIPENGAYLPVPAEEEQGNDEVKDDNKDEGNGGEQLKKSRSFLTIGGINDGATGIREKVIVNSEKFAAAWYTLDGRRLNAQPTAKGIYIHAGKKVVIK